MTRYGVSNDHLFKRNAARPSKAEATAAAARAAQYASADVDESDSAEAHHTCVLVGVDDHDECEICGRWR